MADNLLGRNCSWCDWATPSEIRGSFELCENCVEQFDEVVTTERERIIAILETEATIYADGLLDPAEVIALIKGEHK